MSKEIKICFVCTGNTCRSIMAERILKKMCKERNIKGLKVLSRGVNALGDNITDNAKEILKEFGALSKDRKSIKLKKIDFDTLYIAMTDDIKSRINGKVICIKDLIGSEILDPYMQDLEVYRQTAQQLNKVNEVLIEKILNLRS